MPGYHQCRWGYANWSEVEDVVNTFAAFEIPLDNIWYDGEVVERVHGLTMELGLILTT